MLLSALRQARTLVTMYSDSAKYGKEHFKPLPITIFGLSVKIISVSITGLDRTKELPLKLRLLSDG